MERFEGKTPEPEQDDSLERHALRLIEENRRLKTQKSELEEKLDTKAPASDYNRILDMIEDVEQLLWLNNMMLDEIATQIEGFDFER